MQSEVFIVFREDPFGTSPINIYFLSLLRYKLHLFKAEDTTLRLRSYRQGRQIFERQIASDWRLTE